MDIEINTVFDRLFQLTDVKSDAELAKELGVTPQAIANSRKRGSIPYEKICSYAEKNGLSLDFILLGKKQENSDEEQELLKGLRIGVSASQMAELLHFIFLELDDELFLQEQILESAPYWFISNVYQEVIAHLPAGVSPNSEEAYKIAKHFSKQEVEHYHQVLEIARNNTEKRAREAASQDSGSGNGTTQTFNAQVGQVGGGDINNDFSTKGK